LIPSTKEKQMKLIDVINDVIIPEGETWIDLMEIGEAVGLDIEYNTSGEVMEEAAKRLIWAPLKVWADSDTTVGTEVLTFDGEAVAVRSSSGRKCGQGAWKWLSRDAYDKILAYMLQFIARPGDPYFYTEDELNADESTFHQLEYASQLLDDKGYLRDGSAVTVVENKWNTERYLENCVKVRFEDGRMDEVPTNALIIPYRIKTVIPYQDWRGEMTVSVDLMNRTSTIQTSTVLTYDYLGDHVELLRTAGEACEYTDLITARINQKLNVHWWRPSTTVKATVNTDNPFVYLR
jgi:hypothetical protein